MDPSSLNKMTSKMEIRVWENSPIVGMAIEEIRKKFNINILKVTRGNEARNPPNAEKLDAGDYIYLVGEQKDCIDFINFSRVRNQLA